MQFKGIINAKQGPNTVKRKEKKSASIFSNPWKGDDIESDRLSICKKKKKSTSIHASFFFFLFFYFKSPDWCVFLQSKSQLTSSFWSQVNRRNIFIKLGFVSPEIATKIDLTARPFYSIGSILSPPLNAKAEGKNLLKEFIYIYPFFFLAEIERGKEVLGSCTMVGIIRLRFFSHI